MTFKKLLKALRNPEAYLRFWLYEGCGWGSFAYHESIETAQKMLDYWNQHPDEAGFDATYYRARACLRVPGKKAQEFIVSKEELQKLIDRGY